MYLNAVSCGQVTVSVRHWVACSRWVQGGGDGRKRRDKQKKTLTGIDIANNDKGRTQTLFCVPLPDGLSFKHSSEFLFEADTLEAVQHGEDTERQ